MTARRPDQPSLHGMLIIDKPAHWTSHDAVAWARRWTDERKIGHAGTLDPAATGVLALAVGDGTRVLEYLADADKEYRAEITLGVATDSCDIEGTVVATSDREIAEQQVRNALREFVGEIDQVPPVLSAIRIDGRRAYDRARRGENVVMPVRRVTIRSITPGTYADNVVIADMVCSKGTYVRSVARDLGERLDVPAYLSNLVRIRSGPYSLADAWPIQELETFDPRAAWPEIALHPDTALPDWPALVLDAGHERNWRFGRPVSGPRPSPGRARLYNKIGEWIGLAEYNPIEGAWRPLRVIGTQ